MNLINSLFLFFSKIYIKVFGDKNDYWLILPMHLLSFILTLNVYILVSYFERISVFYSIFFYFTMYFVFFFVLNKRMTFNFVKEYKLSVNEKYLIPLSLVLNLIILLNIIKNQ
jgi:hypothetical protein